MKKLAIIALFSALASGAFAHSRVDTTTPADGVTVEQVPAEISFDFTSDIRLTRVELSHQDQAPVQLDLGAQTSFERAFKVPLPGLGGGTYRIEWRGLGADGHTMQGSFSFEVE